MHFDKISEVYLAVKFNRWRKSGRLGSKGIKFAICDKKGEKISDGHNGKCEQMLEEGYSFALFRVSEIILDSPSDFTSDVSVFGSIDARFQLQKGRYQKRLRKAQSRLKEAGVQLRYSQLDPSKENPATNLLPDYWEYCDDRKVYDGMYFNEGVLERDFIRIEQIEFLTDILLTAASRADMAGSNEASFKQCRYLASLAWDAGEYDDIVREYLPFPGMLSSRAASNMIDQYLSTDKT